MTTKSQANSTHNKRHNRGAKSHVGVGMLVLLLVSCAALVGWRVLSGDASVGGRGTADASNLPIAVEVAPIEAGLMRDVRVLSGTLEASTRFDVATKVDGLVQEIKVDLGDDVERDQVVAILDDSELVQAVAESKAELAVREAELAQAQAELDRVMRDFNRLEALHQRGIASELEFSDVTAQRASQEAAFALAEARVRQAKATLELTSIRIGYTTVRASWQGGPQHVTISARYEDSGDSVETGDPIVAVVGLDPLTAVVSVTERDYASLHVGQEATLVTDARPGETFDAHVARIAPAFQESSRQARVELTVENPRHLLRPGMFIRVRIVLREANAETIVPAAAIVQRGGHKVVFTVDDGAASVTQHQVQTGIERGDRVQIVEPALSGRVIVLGQHLLEDGSTITITDEASGEE